MAEIIKMPKLSDTMTEGVVANWHKKVGDQVKSGDVLAEIETDKATMDFESFTDGVLLHIGVEKGKAAEVDSILAIIGKEGEDISGLMKDQPAPKKEQADQPKKEERAEVAKPMKGVEKGEEILAQVGEEETDQAVEEKAPAPKSNGHAPSAKPAF